MRDGRLQEVGHVDRNFGHWAVFTEIFGVDEVAVVFVLGKLLYNSGFTHTTGTFDEKGCLAVGFCFPTKHLGVNFPLEYCICHKLLNVSRKVRTFSSGRKIRIRLIAFQRNFKNPHLITPRIECKTTKFPRNGSKN